MSGTDLGLCCYQARLKPHLFDLHELGGEDKVAFPLSAYANAVRCLVQAYPVVVHAAAYAIVSTYALAMQFRCTVLQSRMVL